VRVLVVSERLPSRVGGGAARQFNLVRELSSRHEFTIVCFAYPLDYAHVEELQSYAKRVEIVELAVPVAKERPRLYWQLNGWRHMLLDPVPQRAHIPRASAMSESIRRLMRSAHFDLVQVHQAYLVHLVPRTEVPMLLDMHDILSDHEYRLMRAAAKATHRMAGWFEWKKMQALERRAVRRCRVCTTVSGHDRASLFRLVPGARAMIVPNGVDVQYFRPQSLSDTAPSLLFTGSMNYGPNSDAVLWFYHEVLPEVRLQLPSVHLSVVGLNPPPEVDALDDDPCVTVTGYVDDIRAYLADAAVVIVPLRFGSGTRLKILDAWAMGKAVVSTHLGAEGLDAMHGENILLADEPAQFAAYVLRLLRDERQRFRLGRAGRRLVKERYAWSSIATAMEAAYDAACQRSIDQR